MTRPADDGVQLRARVPEAPTGRDRLKWYGPGVIWMVSAAGSGEILFTPRVGARYEYVFLWAAVIVSLFMWVMVREVGRYTIVTGRTILEGYRSVPGPANWALWFIFVPQLVAGVVTVAGMSALVGSALMLALPGSQLLYALLAVLVAMALVVLGQYPRVEKAATVMGAILVGAALVTAIWVFPPLGSLVAGLVPAIPADVDLYFVLPWVGFLHAGAAGIMWYSYWTAARGYAGGTEHAEDRPSADEPTAADLEAEPSDLGRSRADRLRDWHRIMGTTAAIGVTGGLIIITSFLILGAELLAPLGTIPAGIDVAGELTLLLSEVWGQFGYWLLLITIIVALWGTILANLDGWGRTFSDATRLILGLASGRERGGGDSAGGGDAGASAARIRHALPEAVVSLARDRDRLRNAYVVGLLTAIPIGIVLLVQDPVAILSVGGIIAAAHTPVVVFLTLWLNRNRLPEGLQPNLLSIGLMILSGAFFTIFAALYLLDLLGIRLFG